MGLVEASKTNGKWQCVRSDDSGSRYGQRVIVERRDVESDTERQCCFDRVRNQQTL